MKLCFLCTGGYTGKVGYRGWPTPPELCEREEAQRSAENAIRQFRMAEEAGFDWVSLSEHHYAPGLMTPNPIILAAAAARETKTVKIALLGPLVPLINPVRTAEEIAMLDGVSGGRVVVLFLRGTPNEHHTYRAVDSDKTRGITQEGVQLIRRAWTEPQPFAHHGEHFHFDTVSVWPRTVQDPHPPIFYSGNSDESADFAGRHHLNLAIGFAPPPYVAKQVGIYKNAAREAGWEPTHDNVLYRCRAIVADTDAEAEEIANQIPGGAPRQASGEGGQGGGNPAGPAGIQLLGGVDTVMQKVRVLHDAGVGIIDMGVAGGGMRRACDVVHRRFKPALMEVA